MKALVGAFNQEKALVEAFSVIVQPVVEPMDRFTALVKTKPLIHHGDIPGDVHEQGGQHAGHDVHQTPVTLVLNLKSGVKISI